MTERDEKEPALDGRNVKTIGQLFEFCWIAIKQHKTVELNSLIPHLLVLEKTLKAELKLVGGRKDQDSHLNFRDTVDSLLKDFVDLPAHSFDLDTPAVEGPKTSSSKESNFRNDYLILLRTIAEALILCGDDFSALRRLLALYFTCQEEYGLSDFRTLDSLRALGLVIWRLGMPEQAVSILEHALDGAKMIDDGDGDPLIGFFLLDLAEIYTLTHRNIILAKELLAHARKSFKGQAFLNALCLTRSVMWLPSLDVNTRKEMLHEADQLLTCEDVKVPDLPTFEFEKGAVFLFCVVFKPYEPMFLPSSEFAAVMQLRIQVCLELSKVVRFDNIGLDSVLWASKALSFQHDLDRFRYGKIFTKHPPPTKKLSNVFHPHQNRHICISAHLELGVSFDNIGCFDAGNLHLMHAYQLAMEQWNLEQGKFSSEPGSSHLFQVRDRPVTALLLKSALYLVSHYRVRGNEFILRARELITKLNRLLFPLDFGFGFLGLSKPVSNPNKDKLDSLRYMIDVPAIVVASNSGRPHLGRMMLCTFLCSLAHIPQVVACNGDASRLCSFLSQPHQTFGNPSDHETPRGFFEAHNISLTDQEDVSPCTYEFGPTEVTQRLQELMQSAVMSSEPEFVSQMIELSETLYSTLSGVAVQIESEHYSVKKISISNAIQITPGKQIQVDSPVKLFPLSERIDHHRPLLHLACSKGSVDVVRVLSSHVPELHSQVDKFRNTPLLFSLDIGEDEVALELLRSGNADVTLVNSWGVSSLHKAASSETQVLSKLLEILPATGRLKQLINLREQDHGYTPLHVACVNGKPDAVQQLIDCGANVAEFDHNNVGALVYAISSSKECAKIILRFLKNLPRTGSSGTPTFPSVTETRRIVNNCHENGLTCLMIACERGHFQLIEDLLELGADYCRTHSSSRKNVLHVVKNKDDTHLECFRLVLQMAKKQGRCKELNDGRDEYGVTAVSYAANDGDLRFLRLLKQFGFKVDSSSRSCNTVFAAIKGRQPNTLKYLIEDFEANPNVSDETGMTPLHLAAKRNEREILRVLVCNSKQPVDLTSTVNGARAIHLAAASGHDATTLYLLRHSLAGFDLIQHTCHQSAAQQSCPWNQAPALSPLIATDPNGNTLLHLTCKHLLRRTLYWMINYMCRDSPSLLDHLLGYQNYASEFPQILAVKSASTKRFLDNDDAINLRLLSEAGAFRDKGGIDEASPAVLKILSKPLKEIPEEVSSIVANAFSECHPRNCFGLKLLSKIPMALRLSSEEELPEETIFTELMFAFSRIISRDGTLFKELVEKKTIGVSEIREKVKEGVAKRVDSLTFDMLHVGIHLLSRFVFLSLLGWSPVSYAAPIWVKTRSDLSHVFMSTDFDGQELMSWILCAIQAETLSKHMYKPLNPTFFQGVSGMQALAFCRLPGVSVDVAVISLQNAASFVSPPQNQLLPKVNHSFSPERDLFVYVSHRWLCVDHPDPNGDEWRELITYLLNIVQAVCYLVSTMLPSFGLSAKDVLEFLTQISEKNKLSEMPGTTRNFGHFTVTFSFLHALFCCVANCPEQNDRFEWTMKHFFLWYDFVSMAQNTQTQQRLPTEDRLFDATLLQLGFIQNNMHTIAVGALPDFITRAWCVAECLNTINLNKTGGCSLITSTPGFESPLPFEGGVSLVQFSKIQSKCSRVLLSPQNGSNWLSLLSVMGLNITNGDADSFSVCTVMWHSMQYWVKTGCDDVEIGLKTPLFIGAGLASQVESHLKLLKQAHTVSLVKWRSSCQDMLKEYCSQTSFHVIGGSTIWDSFADFGEIVDALIAIIKRKFSNKDKPIIVYLTLGNQNPPHLEDQKMTTVKVVQGPSALSRTSDYYRKLPTYFYFPKESQENIGRLRYSLDSDILQSMNVR